jgi:lycopene cyclase domain-containing protein
MMSSPYGYIFLELAAIVYLLGFGASYLHVPTFRRRALLTTAAGLVVMWFVLDQIALLLGVWTFPTGGTLQFRLFRLPFEEFLGFLLHTIACYALAKRDRVR